MIKIKVLRDGWDVKKVTYYWGLLWTLANFTGILSGIVDLFELNQEHVAVAAQKKVDQKDAKNYKNDEHK